MTFYRFEAISKETKTYILDEVRLYDPKWWFSKNVRKKIMNVYVKTKHHYLLHSESKNHTINYNTNVCT